MSFFSIQLCICICTFHFKNLEEEMGNAIDSITKDNKQGNNTSLAVTLQVHVGATSISGVVF